MLLWKFWCWPKAHHCQRPQHATTQWTLQKHTTVKTTPTTQSNNVPPKTKIKNKFFPQRSNLFQWWTKQLGHNNRNLTLKRHCKTASSGMVVIVVDSLPLESIPSSIVAIAGVSSYVDGLSLRFSNTRTSLCLHFLPLSLSLSHQHFTLSQLSPPFSLPVLPTFSFYQKQLRVTSVRAHQFTFI